MIYFIAMGDTDFVKIGYSESPSGRLRHLQTAHPHELTVIAKAHGNMRMERALQRHFASVKVRGEWFRLSGPIQQFIDSLCLDLDRSRAISIERLVEAAKTHGLDLIGHLE